MTVVIAIPGSEDHAGKLARHLGIDVIAPELRRFPDGELYVRLPRTDEHAILCGSLYPAPAERFMEVALIAGTARDLGAKRVGLVAPYLAFMRQDVQFHPGEGVTARYFGTLVSSVIDWMVTVDPHLHRLPTLDHVYAIPTGIAHAARAIADWVRREVKDPVLVGPDAESEQWVAAVAAACDAPFEICTKTRRGDRDVSIDLPTAVGGGARPASAGLAIDLRGRTWNGHTPVLVDDIVSTGKTMIEATRVLRAAGASAPMCVAIHAVFADALHAELAAAGAAGIVTCNTIPHATNQICVAASIAEATRAFV